jgi:hypothetical protein
MEVSDRSARKGVVIRGRGFWEKYRSDGALWSGVEKTDIPGLLSRGVHTSRDRTNRGNDPSYQESTNKGIDPIRSDIPHWKKNYLRYTYYPPYIPLHHMPCIIPLSL